MTKIYDQHKAAFANVSAYVVLHNGERVATIAFKFPKDGAGRLYAYVHWIGCEMVRGAANGYGYDKCSAAVESAISNISSPHEVIDDRFVKFAAVLKNCGGNNWDRCLSDIGFTVLQAV